MGNWSEKDLLKSAVTLLEAGSSDRKTIAESLNISISAAGNIANTLISMEIVSEYTRKDNSPGRRSSVLKLRDDPVFAVAHISETRIITHYFGYGLTVTGMEIHEIDDPLFIDDVFTSYFRGLSNISPTVCGICLVCGGIPSDDTFIGSGISGIDGLPIIQIAREQLGNGFVMLENKLLWSIADTKGINCIIAEEDGYLRVSIVHDGTLLSGRNGLAGHMGQIRGSDGRNLSSKIRYARTSLDYVSAMTELFSHVILLLDPDKLYFRSERYGVMDTIVKSIEERLVLDHGIPSAHLPKILTECVDFDLSLPRLRRRIRDLFIEDHLKN